MRNMIVVGCLLVVVGICQGQDEAMDATKKSMFSRYGPAESRPSDDMVGREIPRNTPTPVFVGWVLSDDVYTGYLTTGDVTRAIHVGDIVGNDRVVQIASDGMRLANGTVIAVGYDLQNRLATFKSAPPEARRPGTSLAPLSGRQGFGPNQRMRGLRGPMTGTN